MPRNTKKKLAIFAGTSKCLVYAEAKYCASEMPGELKYYECSRTEYCCAFGCCVSPGLHFHHLWYYWILVIIMFLVCSGGGWWYRYWLHGRYRAAASAIPNRTPASRTQNPIRGPTCQAQQARITYNSARNTVLLHRPQRNGASPVYNGNATTSTQYQNMSVVLNDANCPYYQLYGPPPSYETVIAQSRGKVSTPASPEAASTRSSVSPNVIPNPAVPQCFAYPCSPSARMNGSPDQLGAQCRNGAAASRPADARRDGALFPHYSQYCSANGAMRQNLCVPYDCQEQPAASGDGFDRVYRVGPNRYVSYDVDKSSDTSDAENASQRGYEAASGGERYVVPNADRATGGRREQSSREIAGDRSPSRVHGRVDRGAGGKCAERIRPRQEREDAADACNAAASEAEGRREESSATASEPCSDPPTVPRFSRTGKTNDGGGGCRDRRAYGGSLRLAGRYTDAKGDEGTSQCARTHSRVSLHPRDGALDTVRAAGSESTRDAGVFQCIAGAGTSSSQSNPSNNVILGSFLLGDATPRAGDSDGGQCPSHATLGSVNSNLESKHRLDRSRSLE